MYHLFLYNSRGAQRRYFTVKLSVIFQANVPLFFLQIYLANVARSAEACMLYWAKTFCKNSRFSFVWKTQAENRSFMQNVQNIFHFAHK